MEGPLDMALQPVYGEDVYARFDNRGLLRGDTATRVQLYQSLFSMGAISPNTVRDLEDFELLEEPAANQTFMQLGFSTLTAAAAQAGAVQPQDAAPAEAGPVADADPAGEPGAGTQVVGGVDLQATALNGAQVTALLEVLAQVSAGALDQDAAVALITSAFPTVSIDLARQMVAGANVVAQPQPGDPTNA
jgi:hypothetical protein